MKNPINQKEPNFQIDIEPIGKRVYAEPGETLLDAAQNAGIDIISLCGGAGICNSCKVRIIDGRVSEVTRNERTAFTPEEIASGFRLACKATILSNVKIDIPPESLSTPQRLQLEGQEFKAGLEFGKECVIRYYDLELNEPSLTSLESDLSRIKSALEKKGLMEVHCRFEILKNLSDLLRTQRWKVRTVIRYLLDDQHGEVVAVLPVGTPLYGLAVDVGTTKLAAYLVDLDTHDIVEKIGEMNPQIAFGEDVISRIAYCNEHSGGRDVLQKKLVSTINLMIEKMIKKRGIKLERIVECVVVGNTVMHHLFAGIPVKQLGLIPFVPAIADEMNIRACDICINIAKASYVYMPPNIAGYVGADHVSMVMSTRIHEKEGIHLAIDIGTNTEISLAAYGKLICCSCASGPAFEGAHIHHGMRAAAGAIERVKILNGEIRIATIGEKPAIGICGSGIIDAVAELYKEKIIDYRGVFVKKEFLIGIGTKHEGYELVSADFSGNGKSLIVTRNDINEIQLAKAAIRTGIDLLLQETGITYDKIDKFIIAGAFGSYINIRSAIIIGMFPPLPIDRFHQVGNAAGMGAVELLLSLKMRKLTTSFSRRMTYIELTTCPEFQQKFISAMYFPKVVDR